MAAYRSSKHGIGELTTSHIRSRIKKLIGLPEKLHFDSCKQNYTKYSQIAYTVIGL